LSYYSYIIACIRMNSCFGAGRVSNSAKALLASNAYKFSIRKAIDLINTYQQFSVMSRSHKAVLASVQAILTVSPSALPIQILCA